MFWRVVTAPFRLLYSVFRTAVMLSFLLIFFLVVPFVSYFTMLSYQHDANEKLTTDISREYMLMDFSNNTALGLGHDGSPYPTHVPQDYDYKSANAPSHGTLPAQWGFHNFIGFYSDYAVWARGKGAPMYAAYAEAATSSDNLRAALQELRPKQRIVLHYAPKIGMVWHTATMPDVLLYGVCPVPAANCTPSDYQLREGRELFEPIMTDNQSAAVAQMTNMMSDEYWLKEAHANGISNRDYRLKIAAHLNRMRLMEKYTSDLRPSHLSVGLLGTFLFLVLCGLGIAAFRSQVSSYAGSMPTVAPGTDTKPIRLTYATAKEQGAPHREDERIGAGRAYRSEEDERRLQQDRINRRLEEKRKRVASQRREEVPPPPASVLSTDTLAEQFATLGIPVDATDEQIKTAYRDLAMVWHPDRFGDGDTRLKKKAEEQFKTIHAAYTYLQEHNLRPPIASDIENVAPQKSGQWVFVDDEIIQNLKDTKAEADELNKQMREFIDSGQLQEFVKRRQQRH